MEDLDNSIVIHMKNEAIVEGAIIDSIVRHPSFTRFNAILNIIKAYNEAAATAIETASSPCVAAIEINTTEMMLPTIL
jgi:hypothetical protein